MSHTALTQAEKNRRRRKRKQALVAYSFIAPNFIGFAVFTLGPIILAFVIAFMEWDGNNPMKFVGFSNFITIFSEDRFVSSLKNTLVYSLFTVPITLALALGLAILLNQKIRGRNFLRTVTFFPYVASLVAVTAVKNMGYYMVIYLAGLQGISEDLYEAASLDGANALQRFRYVTIPQLRPTTFFVSIILTINCFKVYDIVYMLAGGSNGVINKSAIVLVYYIYEEAFRNWKLGQASASAIILFAIVLVITLIQFGGEKNYAND